MSDEERRLLFGKLLPQARRQEVHAELRGWSWQEPPLSPAYDVRLGVDEIAEKRCGTSRDVYLSRVLGVRARPTRAEREDAALRRSLADVWLRAKRALYVQGPSGCASGLTTVAEPGPEVAADGGPQAGVSSEVEGCEAEALSRKVAALRLFEYHRIVGRVHEVLARQPNVGADSLVALALPLVVEQQLDGALVGLSEHLSAAAVMAFEPVVFGVEFGERREYHRLGTAGHALVLESLHEHPVDVGCVVYVRFDGDRLLVERDLHLIDDELRQWFVDERDERMRMVSEELDPGMPDECDAGCPYQGQCRRG